MKVVQNKYGHYEFVDDVKKDFFTESDFHNIAFEYRCQASECANEKLKEYLESCPVIYTDEHLSSLSLTDEAGFTHKAHLTFIEEISKAPCKHEPSYEQEMFNNPENIKCKNCGVKLSVEWKEKL